jgi:hypothetical protein
LALCKYWSSLSRKLIYTGENIVPELNDDMKVTSTPKNKVVAATGGAAVGSAFAVIITWALNALSDSFQVELPADVSTSLSLIFTSIATFLAGYYTPPGANEGSVVSDDGRVKAAVQ